MDIINSAFKPTLNTKSPVAGLALLAQLPGRLAAVDVDDAEHLEWASHAVL
jgi:hypothetical protein